MCGCNVLFKVVNEAEAEAEEEAEEEAEQEEQKMSAFSRDDEQANPWHISQLNKMGPTAASPSSSSAPSLSSSSSSSAMMTAADQDGDHPFYPLSSFQVSASQPPLRFPTPVMVSDNYFRPKWIGLGERRLKNIVFVLEVRPLLPQSVVAATVHISSNYLPIISLGLILSVFLISLGVLFLF
jgi:hypothetical protein